MWVGTGPEGGPGPGPGYGRGGRGRTGGAEGRSGVCTGGRANAFPRGCEGPLWGHNGRGRGGVPGGRAPRDGGCGRLRSAAARTARTVGYSAA